MSRIDDAHEKIKDINEIIGRLYADAHASGHALSSDFRLAIAVRSRAVHTILEELKREESTRLEPVREFHNMEGAAREPHPPMRPGLGLFTLPFTKKAIREAAEKVFAKGVAKTHVVTFSIDDPVVATIPVGTSVKSEMRDGRQVVTLTGDGISTPSIQLSSLPPGTAEMIEADDADVTIKAWIVDPGSRTQTVHLSSEMMSGGRARIPISREADHLDITFDLPPVDPRSIVEDTSEPAPFKLQRFPCVNPDCDCQFVSVIPGRVMECPRCEWSQVPIAKGADNA